MATSVVEYNTKNYDNLIFTGAKSNDLDGNKAAFVSKAIGGGIRRGRSRRYRTVKRSTVSRKNRRRRSKYYRR